MIEDRYKHNFKAFNGDLYDGKRMLMWCGVVLATTEHDYYTRDGSGTCEDCLSAFALDQLARVP
jgi:hypothetical protein